MKCVVCHCTDERACPAGCSWVLTTPPVCSECVQAFLFFTLWRGIFGLEKAAGAEAVVQVGRRTVPLRAEFNVLAIEAVRHPPSPDAPIAIPTLRQITAIGRRVDKLNAQRERQNRPPNRPTKGRGGKVLVK